MAQPKRYMKHPETGAIIAIDPSQWARYRRAGYTFADAPKPVDAPAAATVVVEDDPDAPKPLTAEQLSAKTKAELLVIAIELGLDDLKDSKKAEIVDAIVAKTTPAG